MSNEWLKNLKVGDRAIYASGSYVGERYIVTVAKVTKQHGGTVFINNPWSRAPSQDISFDAVQGYQRASTGYARARLEEATPEAVTEIRTHRLRDRVVATVTSTGVKALPLDALQQILNIINAHTPKEEKKP